MNNTNNCTPCSNILSPVGIVCESVYAVALCVCMCVWSFPYTPQRVYCFNSDSIANAFCKYIVLCWRPKPKLNNPLVNILASYHFTIISHLASMHNFSLFVQAHYITITNTLLLVASFPIPHLIKQSNIVLMMYFSTNGEWASMNEI